MKLFDSMRASMDEAFASVKRALDGIDDVDYDVDVEPNTERTTVSETRHADGSVTTTKTTVRKIVVRR